jgi:hypothetical protein
MEEKCCHAGFAFKKAVDVVLGWRVDVGMGAALGESLQLLELFGRGPKLG